MIVQSETSQTQKATYCLNQCVWYVQNRQIHGDIDYWLPEDGRRGKWGVTATLLQRGGVSF